MSPIFCWERKHTRQKNSARFKGNAGEAEHLEDIESSNQISVQENHNEQKEKTSEVQAKKSKVRSKPAKSFNCCSAKDQHHSKQLNYFITTVARNIHKRRSRTADSTTNEIRISTGAQSSRSDDGADFLLNLIGRLQAQQGIQSTGEATYNNEEGGDNDDDEEGDDDEDSDDESDMENYEYEEGPTIFDPYGEEDDDELANNGEDEEYSDGLPRVGHNHDENYDESADSGDEMAMDFFEDDFVINDRANAMDPVLLLASAKNQLVPIERKGIIRRRDESQHDDEAEINESASSAKRRKLDDGYVDDKSLKKSNKNDYNDILPALMGDGNNNGDGDGKRDDKKFNDIWNGNKSKSPKNRPNKDNKSSNSNNTSNNNNNNNGEDDMPALIEDIDDDEPPQNPANNSAAQQLFNNPSLLNALLAHRHNVRNRNNNEGNNSNGDQGNGSDDEMPILIESDDEDEGPRNSSRTRPIQVNDDEEDLPELTSEEESDDEAELGFRQIFPPRNMSCPVHGARPTCCAHHAEHGFSTDEDNSDADYDELSDEEDEDEEMTDHDNLVNAFHSALVEHLVHNHPIPQRTSQPSSASSSLRQESPFLRGSPTVSHLLHSSSSSAPGRRRRRVDRDQEEYNEDFELDIHKPVDVPPLVWSDDESGDEQEHEVEEISSDSEQVEPRPEQPQTPAQRDRLQRFLMANLTNAIMSDYLHRHDRDEEDSDDDVDDDEYFEDGEDDEVVQSSPPFSFAPNPQLSQQPQGPRTTNEQGGFQFNFDQPFNPSLNRQGGFNFSSTVPMPHNMSFNFSQTNNSTTSHVFNFGPGPQQPRSGHQVHTVNISWNYTDNSGDNTQNNSQHDDSDFDPNSLHDVD